MFSLLSVTFSNIYAIKLKNDMVWQLKPNCYRKHVDMFNRIKVNTNSILFQQLYITIQKLDSP